MQPPTDSTLPPKRRWLRFSIRAILVVVLLVSLPFAWLSQRIRQSQRETAFAAHVQKAGGEARFDYNAAWPAYPADEPNGPWILRLAFGQNLFSYVCSADLSQVENPDEFAASLGQMSRLETLTLPAGPVSDELIDSVARLPELWELTLDGTAITPDQMRRLAASRSIGALTLRGEAAEDEVLEQLQHDEHLPQLTLLSAPTTDRGLQAVSQIESLYALSIDDAPAVTNQGFQHLTQLPDLHALRMHGTQVTDACVDQLIQMPNLHLAEITPGKLPLQYATTRAFRVDTGEAVDPKKLWRTDCAIGDGMKWAPCIQVDKKNINLDYWDFPADETKN